MLAERKINQFPRNPFIQTIHTAGPSAHVWADGRMYIYASRDMDPPRGCDRMRLFVNGHDFSLLNFVHTGSLLPGANNTVRLESDTCEVSLEAISVEPLH